MSRGIAESDWKILRELDPIARPILPSHRCDREFAEAFDDMRRSAAVMRICHLRKLGLLRDEEFARFSEETRATVQRLLEFADR
jgi:hypothetical protein